MKTTRRSMLKAVGGISLGGILSTIGFGRTRPETLGYTETENETDVLVVGGGPAGIGWELVKDVVTLDGGTLPDFSKVPDSHWMNQVRVNQFLYVLLAEEKCQ